MAPITKGSTAWIHQRLTALCVILGLLILSLALVFFKGHASLELTLGGFVIEPMTLMEKIAYGMRHPMIASVMILTLSAAFYHSFLGIRMILEDYIPKPMMRHGCIFASLLLHLFFAILAVVVIIL